MQSSNDSSNKRNLANALRHQGYLLSEISDRLGIPRGTLHGWLKSLELSEETNLRLQARLKTIRAQNSLGMLEARQKQKRIRDLETERQANDVIAKLTLDDAQKQILCAVFFWCEGGKDTASGWQFINSDPMMIKTFLSLLRDSFTVDETKFRALVHLHDYHDPEAQQDYWSKITRIPRSQFHKPFMKPHTGKQKRPGYPGCVSIRYLDRQFGLLLQMLYTNFGRTF